jgi:hypothetical protein
MVELHVTAEPALLQFEIIDRKLVIAADPAAVAALRGMSERAGGEFGEFGSDAATLVILGNMVEQANFTWVDPTLADAPPGVPTIALLGEEEDAPPMTDAELKGTGLYRIGSLNTPGMDQYLPVLYRWCYMDYATSSPQQDLLNTGRCELRGGPFLVRRGQTELDTTTGAVALCHI